jgi:large conductance mechanosensitive channel
VSPFALEKGTVSRFHFPMKIIQEFREFIARGNVVDLAVGVIIGAAFGQIVNSLVNDVIMPPIGYAMHGIDFRDFFISLDGLPHSPKDADFTKAPIIRYGIFINALIQFLIVAGCVFMLVKGVNKLKRKEAAQPSVPAAPTKSELLLEEIRDLMRKKP